MKLKTNATAAANNRTIEKRLPTRSQHAVNNKHNMSATNSTNAALAIHALRSTSQDFSNTTCSSPSNIGIGTNIKILFDHVDKSLDKLKVVVEFTDMDAMWLTRVYQTYENELWHKKPRCDDFGGKKKWFFYCHLCNNVYHKFHSIKNHLNQHMKLYPYICKLCCMKYTGRNSATRHLKKVHRLAKEHWNDYLTS
ncbi:zinc finger and BTB domain-containing protein 34-like [Lucilia cuprina]|uniref:zinc finger and BTB domain-containing protein 34-like n=1 Tax=Lucilia cuprina TaxID=7375 RepID=UPI001F060F0D|nr:zinc finger and BTB domain-containing protein 34-like [Lucilia cuprina]